MVEKLKRLDEIGIQRTTIAKGMGVSQQVVSMWANGQRRPSRESEERFYTWLNKFKASIAEI